MSEKIVAFSHIESLYVLKKRRKFNVFATAITLDDRKLGSSMYVTKDDIAKLYKAYINGMSNKEINTTISIGPFRLLHCTAPSDDGIVQYYVATIGSFTCRMLPSAYDQFIATLIDANNSIKILPFTKKKKKGLFG